MGPLTPRKASSSSPAPYMTRSQAGERAATTPAKSIQVVNTMTTRAMAQPSHKKISFMDRSYSVAPTSTVFSARSVASEPG